MRTLRRPRWCHRRVAPLTAGARRARLPPVSTSPAVMVGTVAVGVAAGVLSGMFGVGGAVLTTRASGARRHAHRGRGLDRAADPARRHLGHLALQPLRPGELKASASSAAASGAGGGWLAWLSDVVDDRADGDHRRPAAVHGRLHLGAGPAGVARAGGGRRPGVRCRDRPAPGLGDDPDLLRAAAGRRHPVVGLAGRCPLGPHGRPHSGWVVA